MPLHLAPPDQLVRRAAPAALAALLALPLAGCDKFEFLPDNPVEPITPQVLLHRGSGQLTDPPPNTLDAMLYGAALLDGVEMDLEITSDGVVWLGHDNEVYDCAGAVIGCFQELSNAQIEAVATCPGSPGDPGGAGTYRQYDRLDEVLAGVKAVYPSKLYSLDIKGQFCQALGSDGIRQAAIRMAEEVDRIVRSTGLDGRVVTESSQDAFTERLIELASPVYPLVVSLDDIDIPLSHAADLGATGISMKYDPSDPGVEPISASVIEGIHQKGLRIAVWIVNGEADAQAVWAMQPDVIQTDEGNFFSYIPDLPPPLP
jgi:glycerophosphoryl diester phosphodiesterase